MTNSTSNKSYKLKTYLKRCKRLYSLQMRIPGNKNQVRISIHLESQSGDCENLQHISKPKRGYYFQNQ